MIPPSLSPFPVPSCRCRSDRTDPTQPARARRSSAISCAAPWMRPRRQDLGSCGSGSGSGSAACAKQAAKAIRGSDSKISRIELGRHAAREIDVSDLLTLYGVTDPDEREALLSLASQALAPPWWQRSADVLPPWFQAYLGVEEAAESVQSYDTHFVPGLLQTSAYAAGLLARADFAAAEVASLLQVRTERIERFAAGGWRLDAVID